MSKKTSRRTVLKCSIGSAIGLSAIGGTASGARQSAGDDARVHGDQSRIRISSHRPEHLLYDNRSEYHQHLRDRYGERTAAVLTAGPDIDGERVGRMEGETDPDHGSGDHIIEIYDLDETTNDGNALYTAWHWSSGGVNDRWGPDPVLKRLRNGIEVKSGDLQYYDPDEAEKEGGQEFDVEIAPEVDIKGVSLNGSIQTSFTVLSDIIEPYSEETSIVGDQFTFHWRGGARSTRSFEAISVFEGAGSYWSVEGSFYQRTRLV